MSATFELYYALREIEVPAEKARAVVDALAAARKSIARDITEDIPTFIPSSDKQLQQLRDELLELKLQHWADTIVMRVGGFTIVMAGLMLMLRRAFE